MSFKPFRILLIVLAIIGLIIPTQMRTFSQNIPNREIRGVWLTNIDSDILFSRIRLINGLEQLKKLNFNTIYPVVWNAGYTLYPSQVAQREIGESVDPTPGLQNRDLLKELVEQGHRRGLAVIPWFEFGFMTPAQWSVVTKHPDWFTSRQDGNQIWLESPTLARRWLNPFHPEVEKFIVDLILEMVTSYDIDGIQLDDHFGIPSDFGYDPYTVALYQKEHQGVAPPKNFQDPQWVKWRADKITAFLERLFKVIKAKKNNCIISVSPNPYRFSYEKYLADWAKWERMGLVEELLVQIYRNDLARFIAELEQPDLVKAKTHIPVGIGILSGLKGRYISFAQMQSQIAEVRKRQFTGFSFFFYETLWNWTEEPANIRLSGFQTVFANPIKRADVYSKK